MIHPPAAPWPALASCLLASSLVFAPPRPYLLSLRKARDWPRALQSTVSRLDSCLFHTEAGSEAQAWPSLFSGTHNLMYPSPQLWETVSRSFQSLGIPVPGSYLPLGLLTHPSEALGSSCSVTGRLHKTGSCDPSLRWDSGLEWCPAVRTSGGWW